MSIETLDRKIDIARKIIKQADYILIGAGAGLSAAAGLSYSDQALFREHYRPFFDKGFQTIDHVRSKYFLLDRRTDPSLFWGFWCHHIEAIFHKPPQLQLYQDLYKLVADKPHFTITTNVDGQFHKGGFEPDDVFAMQGSYGKFQCIRPCHQAIYENRESVTQMLDGFDPETLAVGNDDIPYCPKCGDLMAYNLRADNTFVEAPHLWNQERYTDFIDQAKEKRLVLLELGVGFNTPVIIRFPFERLTANNPRATLIRLNIEGLAPSIPLSDRFIPIQSDIAAAIRKWI